MLLPQGLIPGAYTPFTADNKLDAKVLSDQLQAVAAGSGGLHGPAGHSEFASLTFDEWKVWTDVLVDISRRNKLPAWAFFGTESFEKTVPYADYALKAGANGFFVIAPYFNKYGQEEGYLYFRDLANAFPDTPLVFYPSHQTGNHFLPSTIAKLAEVPNIVGMKLSSDDRFDEISNIVLQTGDNESFNLVMGSLNHLYPLLCNVDLKASCSPFSPFAHEWSLKLWNAYRDRDWPTVKHWQLKLGRLSRVLNVGGNRQFGARAGHKAALALLGRPVGNPRRPGSPTSDEHVARMRKVFQEEGLL